MEKRINELFNTVIENDYCSGCGACAGVKDSPLTMTITENGKYIPVLENHQNKNKTVDVLSVCPFSNNSIDESEIGFYLYGGIEGIKHSEYTGYYLNNYAGYVKKDEYREKGSSGGIGTWIANQLLKQNLVDGIIHIKSTKGTQGGILFSYQVSSNIKDVSEGAKSKYYPIEMSEVIEYVRDNPGKYALIGIPCFIKSIRLLAEKDNVIKERIKFTIGLVCGHLKTDMFAKSMAWQMGIQPNQLSDIDFRVRIEGSNASSYGIEAKGKIDGKEVVKSSSTTNLYTTNWGHGFFKYKACDFCDDVLAETADITIGDAWLPEYVKDSMGTNIIVVRNPIIMSLIEENIEDLHLEEIGADKIFTSQEGGFRHRREGLSYRLYLKDQKNEWRPKKRVEASNNISNKRKKVYEKRIVLYEESYKAYKKAVENGDFKVFIKYMNPIIKDYNRLISKPFIIRVINKLKRILLKKEA